MSRCAHSVAADASDGDDMAVPSSQKHSVHQFNHVRCILLAGIQIPLKASVDMMPHDWNTFLFSTYHLLLLDCPSKVQTYRPPLWLVANSSEAVACLPDATPTSAHQDCKMWLFRTVPFLR